MAPRKKPVTRRTRRSPAKPRKTTPSKLRRLLKTVAGAAVVSFALASYALHGQWPNESPLQPLLTALGWNPPPTVAPLVAPNGDYAQTSFSQCPQFFPAGKTPVVPATLSLRELCFSAFAVLHSGQSKTPVFVAQRLNRRMLLRARDIERQDRFYSEARLPLSERADLADYRGSGYSRGHMAPAGDMHTDEAMAQSFSLANMVPQVQLQNAGPWSRIEQDTRKYVMRVPSDVYVFTGPVYGDHPRTIGEGKVAVPDHLFKVVHDAGTGKTWVYWQDNRADASAGPPISYTAFVQRTGLYLLGRPASD